MKKLTALKVAGVLAITAMVASPLLAGATAMSTTTLGSNIDEVSGITLDYFGVLIAKYWPFLLGFIILVGVVAFGKRTIHRLFSA